MRFFELVLAVLPLVNATPTPVVVSVDASEGDAASTTQRPTPGFLHVPITNFPALVEIFLIRDIPTVKFVVNGSKEVQAELDTRESSVLIGPDCPGASDADCEAMQRIPFYRRMVRYERYDKFRHYFGYFERLFSHTTLQVGSVDAPMVRIERLRNSTWMFMSYLGLGLHGSRNGTVISRLVQQGQISGRTFGLSLPDFAGNKNGSLVFGGLDKSKFAGSLKRVPLLPEKIAQGSERYWIHLSKVRLDKPDGGEVVIDQERREVFVDSSRLESILPEDITDKIWAEFTALENEVESMSNLEHYFYNHTDMQRLKVDCRLKNKDKAIELEFAEEVTIRVPYSDLVEQMKEEDCYLTVAKPSYLSIEGDYTIGRSVMRSAYMFFDQDKKELWMSQAQDCGSDLQAISSKTPVESVQGNCVKPARMEARRIVLDEDDERVVYEQGHDFVDPENELD